MTIQFRIPGNFTAPNLPELGLLGYTDTFTRPDAETLGSTEDPARPWIVWPSSTIAGVEANAAYAARTGTLGPTLATADAGTADGTVTVTLGAIVSNQIGVTFRASAFSDYYRFTEVNGSSWRLEKITGGSTTVVENASGITPTVGDRMSVILDGPSITCQVNGVTVITTTDAHNQDVTRHGFYNSGPATNRVTAVTVAA